ncbi:ABC transporter permease [Myxococcota bacterium]|nr:ABC transporter permease [Myxococcota bacterium]MBU1899081.1 ABC transporter permease [Myxococcota bacterium]
MRRRLILRRLLALPPVLLLVTALTFTLVELAPGDYVTQWAADPTLSAAHLAALRAEHGLDQPAAWRYLSWLWGALRLDLGQSFRSGMPVLGLIVSRLGNTLMLTGAALVLAWSGALFLGSLAARYAHTRLDQLIRLFAVIGVSTPRLLLGLLALLLALRTQWFPLGELHDALRWPNWSLGRRLLDALHHLCLPTLVLALPEMAAHTRRLRGELIAALAAPFSLTARLHQISAPRALLGALLYASPPMLTLFGYSLSGLLTGAFLVEVLFSWPGMARLFIDAALSQDEPVILAAVSLGALTLMLGNLAADLLHLYVDPRLSEGG